MEKASRGFSRITRIGIKVRIKKIFHERPKKRDSNDEAKARLAEIEKQMKKAKKE
jgi:hypothetical protein